MSFMAILLDTKIRAFVGDEKSPEDNLNQTKKHLDLTGIILLRNWLISERTSKNLVIIRSIIKLRK